ncbi:MAG: phosphoribosylaminoimidazolesuccinocarboxamide synthase [Ignavibacteria bacterium]|nr:phosphoribosylaminoimidazolesuccinocarboxamide synthase [Ignavibacteria bacterium]
MSLIHTTSIESVPLFRRGKVRDVYDLGEHLILVATDRISAFDVIMNEAVPDKGSLLTAISRYWFGNLQHIIPNHLTNVEVDDLAVLTEAERDVLRGRSMIVRKTKPLTIECVVRGYLAGSGWKEYQNSESVCGVRLPSNLAESSALPAPIFTPATKAEEGHDENISFEVAAQLVTQSIAEQVREKSIELYNAAAAECMRKGLILADTKFEFGVTEQGELLLIDEALTPDSSRYWLRDSYAPGKAQENFDKQILRDWLETSGWNKQPPPPTVPEHVIVGTREKYIEAYERITGVEWKN